MDRPTRPPIVAVAMLALVLGAVAAGCAVTARPAGSVAASAAVAPSPAATAAVSSPAPDPTVAAGPPRAELAAEGGDPTEGQLGTFVWGDGGSDSPWLRGSRVAVGSGEPLGVTFRPDVPLATWSARYVPATASDPAGARPLGDGTGHPRFAAPAPGTWTVELHVAFASGLGKASYFWQLAID
jgi:hypothetical protein